jgi:hypothetical protein
MASRRFRFSRLYFLIQLCEAALAAAWPDFGKPWTPRPTRCPSCAAQGDSILDDDAGRFLSCLVCGSSVSFASHDA